MTPAVSGRLLPFEALLSLQAARLPPPSSSGHRRSNLTVIANKARMDALEGGRRDGDSPAMHSAQALTRLHLRRGAGTGGKTDVDGWVSLFPCHRDASRIIFSSINISHRRSQHSLALEAPSAHDFPFPAAILIYIRVDAHRISPRREDRKCSVRQTTPVACTGVSVHAHVPLKRSPDVGGARVDLRPSTRTVPVLSARDNKTSIAIRDPIDADADALVQRFLGWFICADRMGVSAGVGRGGARTTIGTWERRRRRRGARRRRTDRDGRRARCPVSGSSQRTVCSSPSPPPRITRPSWTASRAWSNGPRQAAPPTERRPNAFCQSVSSFKLQASRSIVERCQCDRVVLFA
ncbi:hypothetical protein DFH09DRAFT_1077604 [Mycena vulgaris]|nr:hypothetical protein DFH09DRAFT_1077604 [Mycena vulgaris]